MQRFFLHLAYCGKPYCGWQEQPNGRSVQACVQDALQILLREPIKVVGAGRTDTGVHASSFYAHFDTQKNYSYEQRRAWLYKLNSILDKEIVIYHIFEVEDFLHARFSAIERSYQYFIHTHKNPFLEDYSYFIRMPFKANLIQEAGLLLCGSHDFTSFSKLHTQTKTNVCNLKQANFNYMGEERWFFTFTADRFLRNMVRSMVGTLLQIGMGKISCEDLIDVLEAKDRGRAGMSVPAKALFLTDIKYF
ncbi:MAG: tRNA pseudouridine(38-40) synthase TruA [Bacteroidales bacterium]